MALTLASPSSLSVHPSYSPLLPSSYSFVSVIRNGCSFQRKNLTLHWTLCEEEVEKGLLGGGSRKRTSHSPSIGLSVIVQASSEGKGTGDDVGGSSSEEPNSVENLPLESKLQMKAEAKLRMKLAKKIRLRRKRLVRKRRLRKKGRWPPSKMRKLKNV